MYPKGGKQERGGFSFHKNDDFCPFTAKNKQTKKYQQQNCPKANGDGTRWGLSSN